jgi:hypothetical protein
VVHVVDVEASRAATSSARLLPRSAPASPTATAPAATFLRARARAAGIGNAARVLDLEARLQVDPEVRRGAKIAPQPQRSVGRNAELLLGDALDPRPWQVKLTKPAESSPLSQFAQKIALEAGAASGQSRIAISNVTK